MSMKSFYPRSQKAERAQRADRNAPTLQPETEYCLPGSRFALIMRLARAGASDELFKKKIRGIDQDTIRVARKLADGTISVGNPGNAAHMRADNVADRREEIFRMMDAGVSNTEIQVDLGVAESTIRFYRRQWRNETPLRRCAPAPLGKGEPDTSSVSDADTFPSRGRLREPESQAG